MSAFLVIARAYPKQTLITLLAMLSAAVLDGLSLSIMFPALSLAMSRTSGAGEEASNRLLETFQSLGLPTTLGALLVFIVIGVFLKHIVLLLGNRYIGFTGVKITTDLRLKLLRGLLASRWGYYVNQRIGALATAMASESTRAASAYLNGTRVIASVIETIVYLTVAFLVSWQGAIAAIIVGGLLMSLLGRLVKLARLAGKRRTKLLKSLLARLTDTLQSVKPLKAMGRAELVGEVLESETGRLNKAMRQGVFASEALSAAYEPLTTLFIVASLYVAVTHADLPFATVMVLVIILMRVLGRLGKTQKLYQRLATAEYAFWSIRRTIRKVEAACEPMPGGVQPRFEKQLELKDVCFNYGDNAVLRGVSFALPAGSFSTLTGASGQGKTTLVDIVTGLMEPVKGSVEVDGTPISEIDLASWRRLIGYVPQETLLLHDSIYHNVTLGDPDLNEADAVAALKNAGAWGFVSALPDGIQSEVGERGSMLSGGQRQRINIARALVHRPRLLILDEATSALDPDSEAAICESLAELRGDVTILAISHQPGLREIADAVYQLADGQITTASVGTDHPTPSLSY